MASIVVVPTCTLCQNPRARCGCIASGRRVPNQDPFHPIFDDALSFIADTRYFGRAAHSDALAYIAEARQVALAACASGEIDGFTFARIDRDAHRLVQKADAKLYATRQKLSERDRNAKHRNSDKRAMSIAVLEQYRARFKPVNAF